MMSIQPKWCDLILRLIKSKELRTRIFNCELPVKVIMYETLGLCETPTLVDEDGHISYKGRGKVVGEFICDKVDKFIYKNGGYLIDNNIEYSVKVRKQSCVSDYDFRRYAKEKTVHALNITDVKQYDRPKELGEFRTACKRYHNGWSGCDEYCGIAENGQCIDGFKPITHAFKSWRYCQDPEEGEQ